MTTDAHGSAEADRRITPADVHNVRFPRGTMLHPGYSDAEVDRFVSRMADELAQHISEKAQLRDQLRALQQETEGVVAQEPPSEQAVRILAAAQQTADSYVAEAEEFSRQVTSEARAQYEEQVRAARENAGAIIQAAQEAAARARVVAAGGGAGDVANNAEELQEQVAYLKAFGQAVRVQLRAYLEALLEDVEGQWGQADPAALPQAPVRPPAQRRDSEPAEGTSTRFEANTAGEGPSDGNGLPETVGARQSP